MPQEVNVRGKRRSWPIRLAAFAFVLTFVAACSDSTGPSTPNIDPAATQAALDAVIDQYFVDNPGISSLETFQAHIGNALPGIAPLDLTFHSGSKSLFGLAGRMGVNMSAAYARVSSLPVLLANIPVELLGTTFIFDPDANQFIPSDPPRAGAPAEGVRFILYDGIATLNEVGHLDLVDKSTFGSTSATLDVTLQVFITDVSTTTPLLQYRVTGTATDTGGTLFFTGFLSDGSGQVDFDFEISGSDAAGYSAGFELSAGGIAVTLDIVETQTGVQTLGASIANGSDQIRFLITIATDGEIQGGSGIFFDDGSGEVLVAIFSGNIEQGSPQLTNAQGDPLTQQELVALANIFGAMEYAFVAMEELFFFGLALVGITLFF